MPDLPYNVSEHKWFFLDPLLKKYEGRDSAMFEKLIEDMLPYESCDERARPALEYALHLNKFLFEGGLVSYSAIRRIFQATAIPKHQLRKWIGAVR